MDPSRRRFLQTGALFGAASVLGWQVWGRRPATFDVPAPRALPVARFATLITAFDVFLGDRDAAEAAAVELDLFLSGDGADQVAELSLALGLLEFAPGGFFDTRRFSALDRDAAAAVLEPWATSSLAVRRQIHSALRKAARFIWFNRPETWAQLDYDGPWVK